MEWCVLVMAMAQLLGVLSLSGSLVFGWCSQGLAGNHDGVPGRREGTTRVYKQPPRDGKKGAIVVATSLFAVMGD